MGIRRRKVGLYVALVYGISLSAYGAYFALGGRWEAPGALIFTVGYMFIPMVAALIVQKVIYREEVRRPLRVHFPWNRWLLYAWMLAPILAFATLGMGLLLPGVGYTPDMSGMFERYELDPEQLAQMQSEIERSSIHPIWLGLRQGMLAGVTVSAVAAFGEELGWRGLLLRELEPLGFWRLSLVTGLVWGFWHAPLVLQGHNYPQHPVAGVLMMTAFTILLSPLFSLVTLKANSVLAASVLHGTVNATAGLALLVTEGGTDLTVGLTGVSGMAVLLGVNFGIFWYLRADRETPIGSEGVPTRDPQIPGLRQD